MTAPTKPFRLRVQEALTAELATISRTDGYSYNLATAVFRGRGAFGRSDPLPMLSILEDPKQINDDEATPQQSTATENDYNLILQGFIQDDPDHPTDPAHFLLADVKAKLYAARADRYNILGFGAKRPCIIDLHVGSGVIRPPDMEISEKAWFFLPVRLRLIEDATNAFT